jgi:Cu-Zn family superoxide dismutase
MTIKLVIITAAAALLAGSAAQAQSSPTSLTADLKNSTGQTVGAATLTEAPKGVLLHVEAKGLSPGWHGMHFHEKGDCSKADFTSAGGHTHGAAAQVHGLLNPAANETGDLPNIHADANGAAAAEVFTSLTTLAALRDADGSAVVIHASPDDYMAQPIGGAGARVACAVIK